MSSIDLKLRDEITRYCFAPDTRNFGRHFVPLSEAPEGHREAIWTRYAPHVGSVDDDGNRILWTPRMAELARLLWAQIQRLQGTVTWLVGAAGTGKTTVCLRVVERWLAEGRKLPNRVWLCAPTNKAAGVLRSEALKAGIVLPGNAVQTPHTRFELADINGVFDKLPPRWWPRMLRAYADACRRLYIFDEVFAWSAATLAYSLASIPTGSWVVLVGDWRQLRPVDGTLMAYHLLDMTGVRVPIEKDRGEDVLWQALGREAGLETITLGHLNSLPTGAIPVVELAAVKRVDAPAPALSAAGPAIEAREFPKAGAGLKITTLQSFESATALAVERLRSSEDWFCIVPTNSLACRLTGELNKRRAADLTFQHFPQSEETLRELEECLYFRAGDVVEILVNDHAKGVLKGLLAEYVRWCRPQGERRDCFHEVEILDPDCGRWVRPRIRLHYKPGRYNHFMRAPLEKLLEDYDSDDLAALLGAEQAASTRGLLCSPRIQTNHRAQGSTYRKVVIVIPLNESSPWMSSNWLYVALTRAKFEAEIIFAGQASLSPAENESLKQRVMARLLQPLPTGPNPFRMIDQ